MDEQIWFLIWSNEHNGWWSWNKRGYVQDIKKAGLYAYEEALEICQEGNKHPEKENVPNELMVPNFIEM